MGSYSPFLLSNFFLLYLAFTVFCSMVYNTALSVLGWEYTNITIPPFVYLAICNLIALAPFVLYDNRNYTLEITDQQMRILDKLSIFLALCSVLPFIETVLKLPSALLSQSSAADMYAQRLDGAGDQNYLSFLGRKFYYMLMLFDYAISPLIFIQLTRQKCNKKVVLGLILCLLTKWSFSMILGGRSSMVQNILYTIVVYIIYRRFLPQTINRKILYWGSIVLGFGFFAMMVVTISRFSEMNSKAFDSPLQWMALYLGEGALRFNDQMWYVEKSSGGYLTNQLFVSLFLGRWITVDEIWAAGDKIGIFGNYYYTWIGQFYGDWGRYLTPLIIIILSVIFSRDFAKKKEKVDVVSLFYLGWWAKTLVLSPFFFALAGGPNQLSLLMFVLFCNLVLRKQKS